MALVIIRKKKKKKNEGATWEAGLKRKKPDSNSGLVTMEQMTSSVDLVMAGLDDKASRQP